MADKIYVLAFGDSYGLGKWTYIGSELDDMHEVVGGWIESVTLPNDLVLICNEEGKIQGLKPSLILHSKRYDEIMDIVVGSCFICQYTDEGEMISIDDDHSKFLIDLLSMDTGLGLPILSY